MVDPQLLENDEKLILALRDLSRSARVGSLIQGVSHNLNGVIQILSMEAEMIHRMTKRVEEGRLAPLREKVEHCLGQIDKLKALLNNLQTLSASEEIQSSKKVHLNEVLEKVIAFFNHNLFFKHQVRVKKNFTSRMPAFEGEEADFEEGLSTLIENAIEAMEEAPQKLLTVTTRASHDSIQVVIGDTGCGVPENLRPRLFTPFFTTKNGPHHGLGLYLARKLLTPYQATIEPHFREGETLFFVKIPIRPAKR